MLVLLSRVALGSLATIASLLAVAAALEPGGHQQVLALALLGVVALLLLLVVFRRTLAGGLIRIGSLMAGTVLTPAADRSNLDVSVTVGRLATRHRVRFAGSPGAKPPVGWYELRWRVQFSTRRDLQSAFVALFHDVEQSRRAEADPDCLFRWHATVYANANADAFNLDWIAIDGHPIKIVEERSPKTVRYRFEPASALENPRHEERQVSLAVSLARSDRGGELVVPISVGVPTLGVRLTVDASVLGQPSFDIQDGLQLLAGSPGFSSWAVLFGHANRAVAGVSGGATKALVRGKVTFVITPRLAETLELPTIGKA